MKACTGAFFLFMTFGAAFAAEIANVDYIHQYMASETGLSVPINEANVAKAANVKYLLCAVDRLNEISPRSAETNYCVHPLATEQAADTTSVHAAIERLFNCNLPGGYRPSGSSVCSDCGFGYYCTGNSSRAACTNGGILACPGINNTGDAPLPSAAAGKVNKMLTMDEISALNVPATNMSAWELVASCTGSSAPHAYCGDPASIDATPGCAFGTLEPGTYMFVARYNDSHCIQPDSTDSIGGGFGISNAHLAVFDRAVGYKIVHGVAVFNIFIDTDNANYQNYKISNTPLCEYYNNENHANVFDMSTIPPMSLSIYVLK